MGGNCSTHLPSVFAVVLIFLPLNFILIFSFLEAHPQIFILASLCKIMLSLTSCGSRTCAVIVCTITKKEQTAVINLFILCVLSALLCVLCDTKISSQRAQRTTTITKEVI